MKIPISSEFAQAYMRASVDHDRFQESDIMSMFPRIRLALALGASVALPLAAIPAAYAQDDSDTTASAPDQDSPSADSADYSDTDNSAVDSSDASASDADQNADSDESATALDDQSATDDSSADDSDNGGADQ